MYKMSSINLWICVPCGLLLIQQLAQTEEKKSEGFSLTWLLVPSVSFPSQNWSWNFLILYPTLFSLVRYKMGSITFGYTMHTVFNSTTYTNRRMVFPWAVLSLFISSSPLSAGIFMSHFQQIKIFISVIGRLQTRHLEGQRKATQHNMYLKFLTSQFPETKSTTNMETKQIKYQASQASPSPKLPKNF